MIRTAFSLKTNNKRPLASAMCRGLLCATLLTATFYTPALYAQVAPQNITIPAGELGTALSQFAAKTGQVVYFDASLTEGLTTSGLNGQYSVYGGLTELLGNTGLDVLREDDGSYRVVRPQTTTLPAVKVSADATPNNIPQSHLAYLNKDTSPGALGNKPILDTPFSITVVDSNEIDQRGARSISQIFFNDASVYTPTPSFNIDWWGTRIRGLPVRNTYVDDIAMVLHWGGDFPTEVIDSVSALKGLTGFMYGFGTPGGALSYQLKRPSSTPETSLNIGYRNPKLFIAHVDTSHNLGGDLAIRANVATEQGTAYNDSEIDRSVASLAVDKQFGDSLLWRTTLVYEDSKNTGEPFQFYLDAYDVAGSGGHMPTPTYDYDNINIDNAYYKTETQLASTSVEWRIDDQWSLDYQLGFSRKDHRSNKAFADLLNAEGDYSGAIYNFAGRQDTLFTQAMLQGSVSAFGMKHELVAGLGLQKTEVSYSNFDYRSDEFMGNIHESQSYRVSHTPDFSLNPARPEVVQKNVFLSDTLHFNERWQAIAGLRFTAYDVEDNSYQTRETTPTLALIYKPDLQTSLYGSYVEGLEPGSRVGDLYVNVGELLDATVSRQAEIGIKRQAGALDYSAAIFRIERANQIDVNKDDGLYRTQDGLVQYRGAEFSGAYQFTENLNMGVGAIYLDATIDKVSTANAALKGNTPANAPEWQIVANAQYSVPNTRLSIHGAARYFDAVYNDNNNSLTVSDRTVVNAGFTYDFDVQGQALTLIGNINNVFNEEYWASGGSAEGSANIGEERNVSLMLRAQF